MAYANANAKDIKILEDNGMKDKMDKQVLSDKAKQKVIDNVNQLKVKLEEKQSVLSLGRDKPSKELLGEITDLEKAVKADQDKSDSESENKE